MLLLISARRPSRLAEHVNALIETLQGEFDACLPRLIELWEHSASDRSSDAAFFFVAFTATMRRYPLHSAPDDFRRYFDRGFDDNLRCYEERRQALLELLLPRLSELDPLELTKIAVVLRMTMPEESGGPDEFHVCSAIIERLAEQLDDFCLKQPPHVALELLAEILYVVGHWMPRFHPAFHAQPRFTDVPPALRDLVEVVLARSESVIAALGRGERDQAVEQRFRRNCCRILEWCRTFSVRRETLAQAVSSTLEAEIMDVEGWTLGNVVGAMLTAKLRYNPYPPASILPNLPQLLARGGSPFLVALSRYVNSEELAGDDHRRILIACSDYVLAGHSVDFTALAQLCVAFARRLYVDDGFFDSVERSVPGALCDESAKLGIKGRSLGQLLWALAILGRGNEPMFDAVLAEMTERLREWHHWIQRVPYVRGWVCTPADWARALYSAAIVVPGRAQQFLDATRSCLEGVRLTSGDAILVHYAAKGAGLAGIPRAVESSMDEALRIRALETRTTSPQEDCFVETLRTVCGDATVVANECFEGLFPDARVDFGDGRRFVFEFDGGRTHPTLRRLRGPEPLNRLPGNELLQDFIFLRSGYRVIHVPGRHWRQACDRQGQDIYVRELLGL